MRKNKPPLNNYANVNIASESKFNQKEPIMSEIVCFINTYYVYGLTCVQYSGEHSIKMIEFHIKETVWFV